MSHLVLASELILATGAALTALYLRHTNSLVRQASTNLENHHYESLLRLQKLYGYNPQSLVSLAPKARFWFDFQTQSGLSFIEHGKIRLVAGDILTSDETLEKSLVKLLEEARNNKKLLAFLPVTEKFASAVAPFGFQAVKIGASPYFDLPNWNPRGNKSKKMRAGCNQAKRAGVSVEQIFNKDTAFRLEVFEICKNWRDKRRAGVSFGWLFDLDPFLHDDQKKYFAARDAQGKLVGLLMASPIPAREGWYLEDFLRSHDSPRGTTDLLIYEALKALANEGAKVATLGTVPFATEGEDLFVGDGNKLRRKLLQLSRLGVGLFYNFNGLQRFKSKFVPSWWESEYVLLPKGFFVAPRVAGTFIHAILPNGLIPFALRKL